MNRVIDFLIAALILAIILVLFFLNNSQEVTFSLPLIGTYAMGLGYLTMIFGLIGFALGMFFHFPNLFRKGGGSLKSYKKKVYDLERQIEGMKMSLETLSNTMLRTPVDGNEALLQDIERQTDAAEDLLDDLKS